MLVDAQETQPDAVDRGIRIADLVMTLALFPSRPPGAKWYSGQYIDVLASKADRRRDGVDEAIEKIKQTFNYGAHGRVSVRFSYAVLEANGNNASGRALVWGVFCHLFAQWHADRLRFVRQYHPDMECEHWRDSARTVPRTHEGGQFHRILSCRKVHRLRLRRHHHSTLGCGDGPASRRAAARTYRLGPVRCILSQWQAHRLGLI
jgi:hypothetical protein